MAAWRRLGAIRLRRCGRIGLRPSALNKPTAADDVVVVAVEIQDGNGDGCPLADNLVTFDVQGPAQILGVGNGNPVSHEPDKAQQRRAYHGLCMVLLSLTGEAGTVQLRAAAKGLATAAIRL